MVSKKDRPKKGAKAKSASREYLNEENAEERWLLRLYIAGQTPRSLVALNNLKRICEEHLPGRYTIQVIDLIKSPQLAKEDQIFAVPTLVRELPEPIRKIIGDLSNTERVLVGLDIRPVAGIP